MARRNSISSSSTCEVVDVELAGACASPSTSTLEEETGRGRRVSKPTRRDDEIVQTRTTRRVSAAEGKVQEGSAQKVGTTKARRGRPRKVVVWEEGQPVFQQLDVDSEDEDERDLQATIMSTTSTVAQQPVEITEVIKPVDVPAAALAPEPLNDPSPSSPPPPPPPPPVVPIPVPVDAAPDPKQPVPASPPPRPIGTTEVIILPATSSSQPDFDEAPQPTPTARSRPPPPPQQQPQHRHDSDSDEVDDFFMRRKSVPSAAKALNSSAAATAGKGRRAPMRRPGGGGTSKSASLDPEAANANAGPSLNHSPSKNRISPRPQSTPPPLPSDSSSSSSSSDIEFIEGPGDPTLDFGYRKIKLPSWARQSSPTKLNGNNKRDRSVSKAPQAETKGKGKGKGRAEDRESSSDGFVIARDEGDDDVGARKRKKIKVRSGSSSSAGRSRSRGRSRSLTPPEEVSGEVLQQILRAAHGELGASLDFNSSPSKEDERSRHSSVDSADPDLPPEMYELRSRHLLRQPTQDLTGASSSTHEVDAVAPSEAILLSIRFALQADVTTSTQATLWAHPWATRIDSEAQFAEIFKTISTRYGVREEDLVLTFRGRRVYRFGTPRSLKMCRGGEENELWAYRFEVWQEVEELRRKRIEVEGDGKEDKAVEDGGVRDEGEQLYLSDEDDDGEEVMGVGTSRGLLDDGLEMRSSPLLDLPSLAAAREPDSLDKDELIRLTVRGGPKSSFGFAVKPTFPLRKVLTWYCKKEGIVDAKRIAGMSLEWDGEKLDLDETVADIEEFEDEDTLDVKG
ncbi:BQ2448_6037 [Microbotryum intermedium]|uniref:BQ2448_6037 protein n=1 Tax=Microbotryum intermedium TaxID=269621 RepID=A0A238FK30_9BASI|nr:BQ2448_6037 [Microbotryum intermedium]